MADDTVDDGGEDQDDDQTQAPNVEELEQSLRDAIKERDDEKSRAAGLDRKVTDLAAQNKTLIDKDLNKEERFDRQVIDFEKDKVAWAESVAAQTLELKEMKIKILKHDVLNTMENFPMRFADRIHGETQEEIERDAKVLMADMKREIEPIANARKTTGAPRAGGAGKPSALASMSPEDALKLDRADMKEWSRQASAENVAIFLELQQAQLK